MKINVNLETCCLIFLYFLATIFSANLTEEGHRDTVAEGEDTIEIDLKEIMY